MDELPEKPSLITFALNKRKRTTRASSPKVRTGCITCKRRHVKCDETKPSCTRCIKFQGHCDGYENPEEKSSIKSPRLRPRKGSSSSRRLSASRLDHVLDIDEPAWIKIHRDLGQLYDRDTDGIFDARFWSEVAPRLMRENAAVRHAHAALQTLITAERPAILPLGPKNSVSTQYGKALKYHGLALSELRQAGVKDGDLRAAILCSLLFVVFEMMNDDSAAAQSHLYNGQRMMEELGRGKARTGQEVVCSDLSAEMKQVLQFLALDSWTCCSTASTPPPPPRTLSEVSQNIPLEFTSAEEAKYWFAAIQRVIMESLDQRKLIAGEQEQEPPLLTTMTTATTAATTTTTTTPAPPEDCRWTTLVGCLRAWRSAAEPILEATKSSPMGAASRCAMRTLVMHLAHEAYSLGNLTVKDSSVDLERNYQEIVHMAQFLGRGPFSPPELHGGDTMDNGSAFPLFLVASRTADDSLRQRALQVTGAYSFRAGAWYEGSIADTSSTDPDELILSVSSSGPSYRNVAEVDAGTSDIQLALNMLDTSIEGIADALDGVEAVGVEDGLLDVVEGKGKGMA